MRIIVYGVGAIGGTTAAAIAISGQEIVGIARGAQLDAIWSNGLLLRTHMWSAQAQVPCVSDPSQIDLLASRSAA